MSDGVAGVCSPPHRAAVKGRYSTLPIFLTASVISAASVSQ